MKAKRFGQFENNEREQGFPSAHDILPEKHYNFPEVMEKIRPAATELVRKLKADIESAKYTTLISDEARGRIPTLILREVFKKKAPNAADMKTTFLAFGRDSLRWDDSLSKYIAQHKKEWGKSLIVTEMVSEGTTLKKIWGLLDKENHYADYAVAALFGKIDENGMEEILRGSEMEREFRKRRGKPEPHFNHTLYVGENVEADPLEKEESTVEQLSKMGGIKRRRISSLLFDPNWVREDNYPRYVVGAHPERIDKLLEDPEPIDEVVSKRAEVEFRPEFGESENEARYRVRKDDKKTLAALRKRFKKGKLKYSEEDAINNEIQHAYNEGDKASARRLEQMRDDGKVKLSDEEKKEIQDSINKAREDVELLAEQIIKEVWVRED